MTRRKPMQQGADRIAQEREENYRQGMAELDELVEATLPQVDDLAEDPEERATQVAEIIEQHGDFRSPAEIDALIREASNAELPTRLGQEFWRILEEELPSAGPGEDTAIKAKAAALIRHADSEYKRQLPPGSVVRTSEQNLGFHGVRITTTFADGRKHVVRLTGEQIAEIEEAERQQQAEKDAHRYGKPDRLGVVRLTADEVAKWPSDQVYRFSEEYPLEWADLLKNEAISFTPRT
jgi:hypothetical protein